MAKSDIDILIRQIAKLPALGTRSARRIVLHLLKNKDTELTALIESMQTLSANIKTCPICGNFDTSDVCSICRDEKRDSKTVGFGSFLVPFSAAKKELRPQAESTPGGPAAEGRNAA